MLTAEQLLAAQKANVETLFGLTNKAFEGVEKLVELNLQVAKTSLGEAAETANAVFSVKDAQELLALQASILQPAAEKFAAYTRHVYEIVTTTKDAVGQVAEEKFADVQKDFAANVNTAMQNAPAGTEPVVSLAKSAMASFNNAYSSMQSAAKQVNEVADANIKALTETAAKAAQTPVRKAKAG
jgi:phasin family protein